eukprot:7804163-Alexandrium_andersonii.AAC.1
MPRGRRPWRPPGGGTVSRGGPPSPPQPDETGKLPGAYLGQNLRVGKDGGRVRFANRGGRKAVWNLAVKKLKGQGKGKQDWPEVAALWVPPPVDIASYHERLLNQ